MRALKIICNILLAVILAAALALALVLVVPLVMGDKLYAVQTGSMEPAYMVGSLVAVRPIAAEQAAVGDVITFHMPGFDTPVTHRIIQVNAEERTFLTKGDNNESADFYPVAFDSLEGRVQFGVPYVGTLVSALQTPGGWLALAWVAFLVVVLLFFPDVAARLRGGREVPEPAVAEPAPAGKPVAQSVVAVSAMQADVPLTENAEERWHYRRDGQ